MTNQIEIVKQARRNLPTAQDYSGNEYIVLIRIDFDSYKVRFKRVNYPFNINGNMVSSYYWKYIETKNM